MSIVRMLFSCFGVFVLGWIFFGFLLSGAAFFGGRALEAAADTAEKRAERREASLADHRRETEQRRQGTRIDSQSGRPMQRPRPMVDVSR